MERTTTVMALLEKVGEPHKPSMAQEKVLTLEKERL